MTSHDISNDLKLIIEKYEEFKNYKDNASELASQLNVINDKMNKLHKSFYIDFEIRDEHIRLLKVIDKIKNGYSILSKLPNLNHLKFSEKDIKKCERTAEFGAVVPTLSYQDGKAITQLEFMTYINDFIDTLYPTMCVVKCKGYGGVTNGVCEIDIIESIKIFDHAQYKIDPTSTKFMYSTNKVVTMEYDDYKDYIRDMIPTNCICYECWDDEDDTAIRTTHESEYYLHNINQECHNTRQF